MKTMTIIVDTSFLSWEEEDQLRIEMEVQAEDYNATVSTKFSPSCPVGCDCTSCEPIGTT